MRSSQGNRRPSLSLVQALESRTLLASVYIDPAFGHGGYVREPFSNDKVIETFQTKKGYVLVLQRSGATTFSKLGLGWLRANGTVDRSRSNSGERTTSLPLMSAYDAEMQPDGKVVVYAGDITDAGYDRRFYLLRFDTDGRLDASFGDHGKVEFSYGTPPAVHHGIEGGIALAPDGGIIAVGPASPVPMVTRFTRRGELDRSFGDDGVAPLAFNRAGATSPLLTEDVEQVVIRSDGRIMIVGNADGVDGFVARLTADGRPDTTFTGDGVLTLSGARYPLVEVALHDQLYVRGNDVQTLYRIGPGADHGASRVLNQVRFSTRENDVIGRIRVTADGHLLAMMISRGPSPSDTRIVRLNADLSRDRSFADNGRFTLQGQILRSASDFSVNRDGTMTLRGQYFTIAHTGTEPVSTRLTSAGTLVVRTSFAGSHIRVSRLSRPGDHDLIEVTVDDWRQTVAASKVTRFDLSAAGGDNDVTISVDKPSVIHTGDGRDSVIVTGVAEIYTGGGSDTIHGGRGWDEIFAGDGDDVIVTGTGGARVMAGAGDDTVTVMGRERSYVYGQSGNDTLTASVGRCQLFGDSGNDLLVGGASADYLIGGDGDDTLRSAGGDRDYLDGGKGTDSAAVDSSDMLAHMEQLIA